MKEWYKEQTVRRYMKSCEEWGKTGKKTQNKTKINGELCGEMRNI